MNFLKIIIHMWTLIKKINLIYKLFIKMNGN